MHLTSPICTPMLRIMIQREITTHIEQLFKQFPVLTITGPRQSGKTTLARSTFSQLPYKNLENPETRLFAKEDPVGFLNTVSDGAIIDEIQYAPELSSYIQAIVDEAGKNGMFVLTGSQQFNMIETVSQSLAGRSAIVKLLPFSLQEIQGKYPELGESTDDYLFRGFYPRLYENRIDPSIGLSAYIETYIERDLRQLSQVQDLLLFQKFLKLCAGRTGQLVNFSSLASDTGISHKTAAEWISLLETSFVLFRLPPYFANINKRLIKSPKLYFYDTGLASHLIGIEEKKQLQTHPLRGALFENLVVSELLKFRFNRLKRENLTFFRDAKGHEVDILYTLANEITLIEVKAGATVREDYFKNLEYFDSSIKAAKSKIVVYDGDRNEKWSRGVVTNISGLVQWI